MGICALLAVILLTGCSSIQGRPDRLSSSDLTKFGLTCPTESELTAAHAGETDGQYRDRIISKCITAINGKFGAYTTSLNSERATGEIITDLGAQAATGIAAVAKSARAAAKLAAGSSFLLGVNGTLNKSLYYDKTLDVILASMETRRTNVRTAIISAQVKDPDAKVYRLSHAVLDLERYQDAGDMMAAITGLTATVQASKVEAEKEEAAAHIDIAAGTYNLATPATIEARIKKATTAIDALAKAGELNKLNAISKAIKLHITVTTPPPGATTSTLQAIINIAIMGVASLPTDKQDTAMVGVETAITASTGA
jgi:hypothetical protein